MKKIILCFLCFILFTYGGTAKAAILPSLSVDVKGNIEIGQAIQIIINIDNIDSLYAGAARLKYDPKIFKIISFEKGALIINKGTNTFDVGDKIDNTSGIASFGGFSCVGQTNGFSGSGTFIKINAEVLKKDSFHLKSQQFLASPNDTYNLKIQLYDKNIKEVAYEFKGYELKVSSDGKAEEIKPGSTVIKPDTNSMKKAKTEATVNKENIVVAPDIDSNVKASTDALVVKESETKQESNVVNPNVNSNANSSVNNESEIKEDVSSNVLKNNKAINKETVEINKSEPAFSVKDESGNETIKNSGWKRGMITGSAIALVFAVVGGTYFYRKKHQKQS
ncbi:hypothetical protein G9F73_016030 [Clostridium estertheticum]|uniref:cohesin domain-containing protein n=1 Tax=Clostridium estertheticum TaxID=238834 RepID=UPI0013EEDDC8|nr:cohesin domain-containing protein [Clostridium estertheticum]MBZ9609301.1 hypothetical protein [Clostridium estertheticum]